MLSFFVGSLLKASEGTKHTESFDDPLKIKETDGLKLLTNVSGKVKFLKLPHEINVRVEDFHTVAEATCNRCLNSFKIDLEIPLFEREFIIDLSDRALMEGEDVRYVNKRTNEIELADVIREEILLHFPPIPVCSDSCKGLCDKCFTNLNENTCNCTHDPGSRVSPFKLL